MKGRAADRRVTHTEVERWLAFFNGRTDAQSHIHRCPTGAFERTVDRRMREAAGSIELGLAQEVEQAFELRLGLAGKPAMSVERITKMWASWREDWTQR